MGIESDVEKIVFKAQLTEQDDSNPAKVSICSYLLFMSKQRFKNVLKNAGQSFHS
jgi:hypothetical protein